MIVLLLHTCGDPGVAALANEAGVLAAEELPVRGTSEHLMPAIRRLLDAAGRRVGDLGAVGVVVGPGSFTGVRVGLSAAKGLCEGLGGGLGVGMIGMSRLALVAAAADAEGRTVAVLDGGRGEFYCGLYEGQRCMAEDLLTEANAREWIVGAAALTCEARVAQRLGIRLVGEPDAQALRARVLTRIAAGEWSDVATIDANYLRRTDAELLAHRT